MPSAAENLEEKISKQIFAQAENIELVKIRATYKVAIISTLCYSCIFVKFVGKKLLFVFVVYRPVFLRCFIRCFCDWRFLCALFNEVLSKHDCYDSNHKFIVLSDRSNI